MNGAGESRRRTAPPQTSQVVNAGSEIRWRISKTRRHLSHSYSYVGTMHSVYMGARNVSRQPAIVIMLLTSIGWLAGCAETGKVPETQRFEAKAAYERGQAALAQHQYALALQPLVQANALDPEVPQYRNALGLVYLQLGRADLALPEFRRATVADPEYAEGLLNTGVALAALGQWSDAVASYQRAIQSPRLTSPDTAYQNLGWALYQLTRYAEAEAALRFAISLAPDLAIAHYNLGLVLIAEDRKDEARLVLRRARDLEPDSSIGHAAAERLKALGDGG
jgi:tetratricopeptide (TPR) repeat protein